MDRAFDAVAHLRRDIVTTTNVIAAQTANINQNKVLEALELQNSLANRTSLMLATTVSTLAGILVVTAIAWDAWKASEKMEFGVQRRRRNFLDKIHPAEIIPLAISVAVVMQGLIILGIQGTGFKALWMGNCKQITEILYPAIWIPGYVLLVFSLETAVRGFKANRFGPRGRWNTSICWTAVSIMLIFSWLPTQLRPAPTDMCLANIEFWVAFWGDISLFITSGMIGLYVLITGLIVMQLLRPAKIAREERIAASRTVYYLAIGIIVFVFMMPYWAVLEESNFKDFNTARLLAGMALTLFGTISGLTHLILRGNSEKLAIYPWTSRRKIRRRDWRFFGSTDLDIGAIISGPIESKDPFSQEYQDYSRNDTELGRTATNASNERWLPPRPTTSRPQTTESQLARKSSTYSVFPFSSGGDVLAPPVPTWDGQRHRREDSALSSATIQIGLRLSHMAPAAMQASLPQPPSSQPPTSQLPTPPNTQQQAPRLKKPASAVKPSPLSRRISTTSLDVPLRVASSIDPAKKAQQARGVPEVPTGNSVDRMKRLPPVPETASNMTESSSLLPGLRSLPRSQVSRPGSSSVQSSASSATSQWPLKPEPAAAQDLTLLPSTTYRQDRGGPWI